MDTEEPIANQPEEPQAHALDARMCTLLAKIEPPPGGLDAVLAAMQSGVGKQQEHVLHPAPTLWGRRTWLGAAAAAVATAGAGILWQKYQEFDSATGLASADAFVADAVRKAKGLIRLRKHTPDWNDLKADQLALNVPVPEFCLSKLANFSSKGCQDYAWRGHRVGLLCFTTTAGDLAHLFTVKKQAFSAPTTMPSTPCQLRKAHGRDVCFWAEGETFCTLVGSSPETDLSPVRAKLV